MFKKRGKKKLSLIKNHGNLKKPEDFFKKNFRGQVTIFIIIAIIIVVGIVGFLLLRQNIGITNVPASIQPVYNSFISCLEDKTSIGIGILETQAGYIEIPKFESGSPYMPFSSQLDLFGNPIPYWYYVSGNNIQKEQVPSQSDMEKSLASFIDDKIRECNFDSYYQEGFDITQGEPTATVSIKNNNVNVKLNMDLTITKGEDTVLVGTHSASVSSNLGMLYNSAKTVYNKEQKELFLEDYGIDILRLYAPVDGVDLSCSPKTWNANDIFSKLRTAIETNTLALSTQNPTTQNGKYFYVDTGTSAGVRFINSANWSNTLEVLPSQGALLIANPVGNQQGLGALGFCYIPYHFVYNVKYPVLVQVYSGDEIFQFPMAVVIQGNKPRVALNSTAETSTSELCNYKNTPTTITTSDTNLNPVDSEIFYECFGESCDIGKTNSGTLTASFPQCVNGYVIAKADGFKDTKYLYSTIQQGSATIVMDKLYTLNVNLKLGGVAYNGKAIIYFDSPTDSKTVSYPDQRTVQLGEGEYNISVYIYKDSSIQLQATTQQECTTVSSSGIGGLLGLTEKKCFDVTIPSQLISGVLAGGGTQDSYFFESELKNANTLEISADSLAVPTTIEQLQNNYILFDSKGLGVSLK
jgi:hypothetical protein